MTKFDNTGKIHVQFDSGELHHYRPHSWYKIFDDTETSISSSLTLSDARRNLDKQKSDRLTNRELSELSALYKKLDCDRNGRIDFSEIVPTLKALKPSATEAEIQHVMKSADLDHSGWMSYCTAHHE